jgi:hypothetical protein
MKKTIVALLTLLCIPAWAQTGSVLVPPQGRVTLTSGVPVLSGTGVSGATIVYYTPYVGNIVPIYNGSQFIPTSCPEISNVLANSATGNAGPFAAAGNAMYDFFVWSISGTCTLTRGDFWQQTATVTNTHVMGADIVFTQASHGFYNGATLRLNCIGGGSLSNPLAQNTAYFVVGTTANTFKVTASFGGSPIQSSDGSVATCGTSQQATEALTGQNTNSTFNLAARGAAPALTLLNGIYVNTNAITNGPGARQGTYVGTCMTSPATAGVVDFLPGSGGPVHLHCWNMYNRTLRSANVLDSSGTYTYSAAAWRQANNSAKNAMSLITGIREDGICTFYQQQVVTTPDAGSYSEFAIGFDAPFSVGNVPGVDVPPIFVQTDAAVAHTGSGTAGICHNALSIGWHEWEAIERGDGTHLNTFNGSVAGGILSLSMRN